MTDTTVVTEKPLCVDLDGTLVATDTLWEGVLRLVLRNPLMVFAVFRWMLAGEGGAETGRCRPCATRSGRLAGQARPA